MDAKVVRIAKGGRLTLPAAMRRAIGIADGDTVMIERQGNALRLIPVRIQLDDIQAACSKVLTGGHIVDEFLAERRQEVAKEFD